MKSRWRWAVLAGTVLAAACEAPPPAVAERIPRPALEQLDEDARRRIETARAALESLDKNVQSSAQAAALAALGEAYSRAHLLEAALVTLLQAQRLATQDFRVVFNLGYVYESLGRLGDAVRSYQHALKLRPEYLEGYVRVGWVLLDFHRLSEAGAAFEKALSGEPAVRGSALMGLGQVALRLHEYEAAKGHLLQLLKQWPDLGRAHYSLALAYRGLGQTDQAREHLARHKRLEAESIAAFRVEAEKIPTQAQAHGRHGHEAFNAGRYAEAEQVFRASLAADPAFSPSRLYLARPLFLRGDPAEDAARSGLGTLLRHRSRGDALSRAPGGLRQDRRPTAGDRSLSRVL